jgi:CDP-diglyceride synthetase
MDEFFGISSTLLLLLIPLIILELGLMIWALLDVIKRERVKGGNKVVWILIIVLVNIIGPIIYLLVGREEDSVAGDQV